MITHKNPRVANPIAVRRYHVVGEPDREVVLTIGKPRPHADPSGDWMCSVLIEGIPKARRRRIHGVDAIQALQLAMEYARRTLDASGLVLTWTYASEPGDISLPFSAPVAWGLPFQLQMERYMQQEEERYVREGLAKKERERQRGKGTPRPQ